MSRLKCQEIEVGVRGQRISVIGSIPAGSGGREYAQTAELDLDLSLARELIRLIAGMIPLAEASKPAAELVPIAAQDEAG